jgi:hypothetical protein
MRLVIAVDKERETAAIEVLDRAGVAGFAVLPSMLGGIRGDRS